MAKKYSFLPLVQGKFLMSIFNSYGESDEFGNSVYVCVFWGRINCLGTFIAALYRGTDRRKEGIGDGASFNGNDGS